MITMVQKGVLIPLSLLLAACSSQPQAGEDGSVRGYTQTGLASYYADRYHNKRTASGELHKRGGNTAAHMTLPFGTQTARAWWYGSTTGATLPGDASSISPGQRSAPLAIPDPGLSRSG